MKETESAYLLGVNSAELERLRFQHEVWREITNGLFKRLPVQKGWKCLDAGAGPGFVAMDLSEHVGKEGEVTLLEPSTQYVHWFAEEAKNLGITNCTLLHGSVEETELPLQYYDCIFIRWVIAFVPDPERFLSRLIQALKPGGILIVQDYYYEGLSLFPKGGAFDRMSDIVRSYYNSGGGDPYVTGKIPAWFRNYGLQMLEFSPHSLAGDNNSAIMEWAHRFFVPHLPIMADRGIISRDEASDILDDWFAHRENPDALFFSPIVMDVVGRLPAHE